MRLNDLILKQMKVTIKLSKQKYKFNELKQTIKTIRCQMSLNDGIYVLTMAKSNRQRVEFPN